MAAAGLDDVAVAEEARDLGRLGRRLDDHEPSATCSPLPLISACFQNRSLPCASSPPGWPRLLYGQSPNFGAKRQLPNGPFPAAVSAEEAVQDERPDQCGRTSRHEGGGVGPQQRGHGLDDRARGSSPSQAPSNAGQGGVELDRPAEARAAGEARCAAGRRRPGRPGSPRPRRRRAASGVASRSRSVSRAARSTAVSGGRQRRADRLLDRHRASASIRTLGRLRPALWSTSQPMPDRLDPQPIEVVQPGRVPVAVGRRPGKARVGQPELDVLGRLQDLALHDVRVAAGGGDPARRAGRSSPARARAPSCPAPGAGRRRRDGRRRP